ncbi:hypothetical protein MRX96_019777 [Rhipicephalus microplus]
MTSAGGGRYPTRAVSVDRATSSSSSLLSRWRQVGRSKSASISEPREYPPRRRQRQAHAAAATSPVGRIQAVW